MAEIIYLADRRAGKSVLASVAPTSAPVAQPAAVICDAFFVQENGVEKINYESMIARAMKQVVVDTLNGVQREGLPNDCAIYMSFNAEVEGIEAPAWLLEKHTPVLTLVLDQWWSDLSATMEKIEVTLNFSNQKERLVLPMSSLISFHDTQTKFGLMLQKPKNQAKEAVQ